MVVDDKLIEYVADLSRLHLSAEEKEARRGDLADIIGYVDKLGEVDTAGVPEMAHPFDAENRFREDVVANADRREEMLANAPARKGDYFKVFKTVEE
jgi:aspartyl-tRNA(Asn)/glutamyl-tRNA(Gln) amidotransferase subunit C